MKRRAGILVGLVAASCTFTPEDNFDVGFGGPSASSDGALTGSTGPQPTPDPVPGGTDGDSNSNGNGDDSSSGDGDGDSDSDSDGSTSNPAAETSETGDPAGDTNTCPANILDEARSGTTFGQPNTSSGSCGGAEAPDQAFEFTAAQDGIYTFSTNGSAFDTVLYVLDGEDCDGPELACDDDGGDSIQSQVAVVLSEGQTVVVVVDGFNSSSGAFTLTTSAQTAQGCNANNLAGALPLTSGGSTSGISTLGGSCGGDEAPELAFAWTAPQAGTYTIHTTGSNFDTVLYVRDGSCLGEELGCDDDGGPSTQSALALNLAAGQDIVIFADGYNTSSGTVVLTIE